MNAAPHESRIKFSPMPVPPKAMTKGECPFRLRLNSGAALHPRRKRAECGAGATRWRVRLEALTRKSPAEAGLSADCGAGISRRPIRSCSRANTSELGRRHLSRCALFTTLLKDRQQTSVWNTSVRLCKSGYVSLVAFLIVTSSSLIGAVLNARNCNRSDRWLRTRIRRSRVALPPETPSGETAAGTLSGMTLAEQRVVPQPRPAVVTVRRVGALTRSAPCLICALG
jgi:hypothetical protein